MNSTNDVIILLEFEIMTLQEQEWLAKEAKDYPACMYLYGAVIYFKSFLAKLRKEDIENGKLV